MNLEWAKRWIGSFGDVEKAMEFYAEECDFRDFPLEHFFHNDKPGLARAFAPFGNADPDNGQGIHSFEVLEFRGDERSAIILFGWTARHCDSFFGLPNPDRRELRTVGMSYHEYRDGQIVREYVHSDQIHVVQALGYPVEIPHYWEEPAA